MFSKLTRKWYKTIATMLVSVSIVLTGCTTPTENTTPTISYGPVGGNATITTSGNTTTAVTPGTGATGAPVVTGNTTQVVATPPPTTGPKPYTATTGTVNLNGAGATFPFPLYSKLFDEYAKLTGAKINYQSIGSGGGITQITALTVDFGATDGIMTDAQITAASAAGGPILHIPMTSGSEAIIYNLTGVATGLKLTPDVLADIYLKVIKNWNDPRITALNPGVNLPNLAIAVVHRSDSSGTTNIFTNYLAKVSPVWSANVGAANSVNWPGDVGGSGNAGVAGQVAQIPGGIGYVELAYAIQNNLPYAQLKNGAGTYVSPSLASTTAAAQGVTLPADMKIMLTNSTNADAYPIVGFTWLLVYVNQTDMFKGQTLVNYLWWAIHDGQQYVEPLLYAKLSPAAVTLAENEILSIKWNGHALLTR